MSLPAPVRLLATLLGLLLVVGLAAAPVAEAGRSGRRADGPGPTAWAPAAQATITPGVMTYTHGEQCTGGFVLTDDSGAVYVAYAAHCAGLGAATDTNGCTTRTLPLGTRVTFAAGGSPAGPGTTVGHGTLAYSSWVAMRRLGTRDPDVCAANDLALVRVDAADVHEVNPSVPTWGGPTGLDANGLAAGDRVWTYGGSDLRAGVTALSPHAGVALTTQESGWSHTVMTASPGLPGDSGSGVLSAGGRAVGILSTVDLTPVPTANDVGDLARELDFAREHGELAGLLLVPGTRPFDGVLP